ncbi:serine hydroxymethyltransferase [Pleomorphomonas diazotrophica]|uniref:Serine hydroxymethyltransferase n=1 Tax=Pleomorphomonas diazotrophica TaxID=1166257 RepID=A0A1I4QZS6_9HYPH|nr:serine hydroxymethyltransferase [Pleomorphomonas diazotrophica]PKR90322.1 serine hydroxymethyltransferase [Pleomorphomonas diazotrophica]SFM45210.1 hypothetical protein SAMN05192571_101766 [Pleomorphomonas diazotrophica]
MAGPTEEREVYFEFVALGNVVRVSAICSVTGVEVQVLGPAGAARLDLERLALRKLERRLAETKAQPLPQAGRKGFTV